MLLIKLLLLSALMPQAIMAELSSKARSSDWPIENQNRAQKAVGEKFYRGVVDGEREECHFAPRILGLFLAANDAAMV